MEKSIKEKPIKIKIPKIKSVKMNNGSKMFKSLEKSQARAGRIFVYIWVVGFLFFVANPFIQSLIFSFNRINPNPGTGAVGNTLQFKFVGWENYIKAFTSDQTVIPKLINALSDTLIKVVLITFFSLFVSILLNRKFIGRGFIRAMFFLPVIITCGAVVYTMSGDVAQQFTTGGAASGMPMLQTVSFKTMLLNMTNQAEWVSVITDVIDKVYIIIWASGVQVLLFLSGLQSISPSLYECASIEGSTGWESFWKITFPMISPIIIVNMVYTVIDTFTDINNEMLKYIQDTAIGAQSMDYGYSAALAWIYFIIIVIFLVIGVGTISRKAFYINE